jgi:hypothetical protein
LRLGYSAWSEGEQEKAITFSRKALALALMTGDRNDEHGISIAKIKNNLAYYYAEAKIEEKAEEALLFAAEAVQAVKGDTQLQSQYAKCMDTLGFAKIAFAKSHAQIQEGIEICEEARRAGGKLNFYFKHIAQAEGYFGELLN